MREYPFASLISKDDDDQPFVTHLPLHLEERADGYILLAHFAKASPHWRYLQQRPRALVTFMGPHAYLSPQIYPDLTRVPSWNYLTVHAQVTSTLVEEPAQKDALLKKLIQDHEPAYAQQWRGLGREFQEKMLAGIVGAELAITRLDCKLKLNQHRPESHARLHEQYAAGSDHERALASWMVRLELV